MNRAESIPVYDSARRRFPALEELQEILHYRNLLVQLVRRDILTRYKRSVLGVAWTMLNPLGTMIVLTIAFSSVFGGTRAYAAYVLSGLIVWTFFSLTTNAAIVNLVWGGSLLRRIYIPPTSFAISAIGTGLVNMVLSIIPLLIVMVATKVPVKATFLLLPIPMIILAIYFADIAEMYQVALTAWMYLTPIIYPETIIPPDYRVWIIRLNPMYHFVKLFRAPIYDGRVPTLSEFLISTGIAVITLIIGWFFFTRRADEFAYRV
jgi:ABC-2 type transport system permease protein